ncbi:MAG: dihydroorotate dehydrogenase-like protein [bacterium]
MADLSTKYMGFNLRSPIIAASSGLTNSLQDLKEIEKFGAGAVVLKSLFEEEINIELQKSLTEMNRPGTLYPEIYDFFSYDDAEDSVSKYLFLIEKAKKVLQIPVIASINCMSATDWIGFSKRIEEAGADGIELNLFILPSDFNRSIEDTEKVYFDVINSVKKEVKLPIALKTSFYFSNLGQMLQKLSETGISSLVLFNRFWSPDFDIETFKLLSSHVLSTPGELAISLRWIAIMANRVKCDLAASTGIHDGRAVIKQLLAGANAVQVASALYRNGFPKIQKMLDEVEEWMNRKNYKTIDEFRGKLSQSQSDNPASFERVQFMKHFSGK